MWNVCSFMKIYCILKLSLKFGLSGVYKKYFFSQLYCNHTSISQFFFFSYQSYSIFMYVKCVWFMKIHGILKLSLKSGLLGVYKIFLSLKIKFFLFDFIAITPQSPNNFFLLKHYYYRYVKCVWFLWRFMVYWS